MANAPACLLRLRLHFMNGDRGCMIQGVRSKTPSKEILSSAALRQLRTNKSTAQIKLRKCGLSPGKVLAGKKIDRHVPAINKRLADGIDAADGPGGGRGGRGATAPLRGARRVGYRTTTQARAGSYRRLETNQSVYKFDPCAPPSLL